MIKNKTVLITGGSSGIGRVTVDLFLKNKNKVINIDKKKLNLKKKDYHFYEYDLENTEKIESLLKTIYLKIKNIDILILNAGICPFEKFFNIEKKTFDKVLNVNQKTPFFITKYVSKKMVQNKIKGKIIFISSISSIFGGEFQTHYCGTKGAINQIMKSVCIGLGKYKINVNAVLPGTVITNINKNELKKNKKLKNYFINRTPLRKLVTTHEIANIIFFLSSELSSGINGETIIVDGGMSINLQ